MRKAGITTCLLSLLSLLSYGHAAAAQTAGQNASSVETLTTIIVTAEKIREPLNEVPASITPLQGSALDSMGANSVYDFAALVPGLQISGGGEGGNTLVLRGINTGGRDQGALVGVQVDGVPIGGTSLQSNSGFLTLDATLWDLKRVEVLRGPQGTLYGATGISGLLSYIYNDPSLSHFEGRGEGGVSWTQSAGTSYATRGTLSMPLISDVLAFRLAALHEENGGFTNDSAVGGTRVDSDKSDSVRGEFLLEPNDALRVKLSGLYQRTRRSASDYVLYDRATGQPVNGPLNDSLPGILDPAVFELSLGALTVDYDLGWASLTSITGYQRDKGDEENNFYASPETVVIQSLVPSVPITVGAPINSDTDKTTEELRLASKSRGGLRYLAGFFYDHEDSSAVEAVTTNLLDPPSFPVFLPLSPPDGGLLTITTPSSYTEYALYAQGSYMVASRLELTGGVRYSHEEQSFSQAATGFVSFLEVQVPHTETSENRPNYLFTARYKLTNHSNVYVRAASGYRPGGPNAVLPGASPTYKPDDLWDYEAGYKGTALDGRVDVQADAFFISWNDIQVETVTAIGFPTRVNGQGAISKGLEAQGSFIPFRGATLSANVAYTEAYLKDALPALGGVVGERLPYSPRWSGAVVGDYRFALGDNLEGFVGGTVEAVGSRTRSFSANVGSPNFLLHSYVLGNARAGVQSGHWTLTASVHNVGNERAEYSAFTDNVLTVDDALVTIARPRTYGLVLDVDF